MPSTGRAVAEYVINERAINSASGDGKITSIIGAVIGKPMRFVDESPDEALARCVREGFTPSCRQEGDRAA